MQILKLRPKDQSMDVHIPSLSACSFNKKGKKAYHNRIQYTFIRKAQLVTVHILWREMREKKNAENRNK
jgi:hypothetical protein